MPVGKIVERIREFRRAYKAKMRSRFINRFSVYRVDPFSDALEAGFTILFLTGIPDHPDAFAHLQQTEHGWTLKLDSTQPLNRQRFAVAHAMGRVKNNQQGPFEPETMDSYNLYNYDFNDQVAMRWAVDYLVPMPSLLRIIESARSALLDIDALCEIFQVSQVLMAHRCHSIKPGC